MNFLIALGISIFFLSFWWWRTNQYDNINPEPFGTRMKFFFLGSFVAIAIALCVNFTIKKLGIPFDPKTNLLPYVFVNAFIEEFAKFYALLLLIKENRHADEPRDIFAYGFSIILGFAFFENILYIAGNLNHAISLSIFRGLLSTPGHLLFSSFFLLFLAKKWYHESKPTLNLELFIKTLPFIIISTLFHFSFNYLLFLKNGILLLIIAILLFMVNKYFKKQYYAFFNGK